MMDEFLDDIQPPPHDPTGGNAFPFEGGENNNKPPHSGMSLRDYFAAKAMQGYLASCDRHFEPVEFADTIARDSYTLADAMLKQREVKND